MYNHLRYLQKWDTKIRFLCDFRWIQDLGGLCNFSGDHSEKLQSSNFRTYLCNFGWHRAIGFSDEDNRSVFQIVKDFCVFSDAFDISWVTTSKVISPWWWQYWSLSWCKERSHFYGFNMFMMRRITLIPRLHIQSRLICYDEDIPRISHCLSVNILDSIILYLSTLSRCNNEEI